MTQLTEFQQRSIAMALTKMFNGRHFDICAVREMATLLQRQIGGPNYTALQLLHCVNWGDMGPDLARQTREMTLELLGLPPEAVNVIVREVPDPQPAQAQPNVVRPGLLGWITRRAG